MIQKVSILLLLAVTLCGCAKRIADKYHGNYVEVGNTAAFFRIHGVRDCSMNASDYSCFGQCTIEGDTLMFTADKNRQCEVSKVYPEFSDGLEPMKIDDLSFTTSTGRRFTKGEPTQRVATDSRRESATSTPSPTNSQNSLNQEEMVRIMQTRGVWNMYSGTRFYEKVEVVQVGEFNEQGKYWPTRVRINKRSGGSVTVDINVVYFSKNDFGEWQAKCMNC